jgi:hypothetical protein
MSWTKGEKDDYNRIAVVPVNSSPEELESVRIAQKILAIHFLQPGTEASRAFEFAH